MRREGRTTAGRRGVAAALLPPEELVRLGSLELVARLVVEGTVAGRHRSPGRGGSHEFAAHRPYVPGDDLRRVDWKVYGRTDRYYVRESVAETNLRAMIVLDSSASMAFSAGGRIAKLEYARTMAAALVHLLIGQQDAVGVAMFGDRLERYVPPRGGRRQRARLFDVLTEIEASGGTTPDGPFRELAERLPRRGLLVLLSDLLGPPERFLPGLRYFRARGHEVVVFHVLDPSERTLSGLGAPGRFEDVESGAVLRAEPAELVEGYRAALADLESTYRKQAHDRGFDFVPIVTSEPIGSALGRWLARRSGR